MYPVRRPDVLAKQPHRGLGDGDGIRGVDPLLRIGRGMGGLAVVVHIEMGHSQAAHTVLLDW